MGLARLAWKTGKAVRALPDIHERLVVVGNLPAVRGGGCIFAFLHQVCDVDLGLRELLQQLTQVGTLALHLRRD